MRRGDLAVAFRRDASLVAVSKWVPMENAAYGYFHLN
jgi:hypothetical protein